MTESVTIGIVHDDKIDAQFVVSLVQLLSTRRDNIMGRVAFRGGVVGRLDRGRTDVIRLFLENEALEADWLLMVDSDMVFGTPQFDRILETADPVTRPIVTGLYLRASQPPSPCVFELKDGHLRIKDNIQPDKVQRIDSAGLGFTLAHRAALEHMREETGGWCDNSDTNGHGEPLADDASFFQRARQSGFPIYLDSAVEVGHVKPGLLVPEQYWMERGWRTN